MQNLNYNQINWSEAELLTLKNRILKRVNLVWFLRKVLAPAVFVFTVSGFALFYAVSSQHVAVITQNISNRLSAFDLVGLAKYVLIAVQKTELDLLAMAVSATLLALYFGRKLIREAFNFRTKGAFAK